MIPEDIISRVRDSVNLVELVREHVPALKKRGRNYMARCPFHDERTPSFNVNPEMGLFKCFGCGAGGDAFKFLMLTEGLNYPESIRKIASRVGIEIPEEQQSESLTLEAKQKQVLYGLLEDAARFYNRYLLESSEGSAALDYLTQRGLTKESLVKFAIGFAPVSGTALRDAASRKGWSVEVLEQAGLVRRKEGGRVHDAFWNRIMFPIWDTQGRIVAFGGRAMGDAMPKYINSSETPVYSKSRHLYGLFQGLSTLRKEHHAVILEGYMDVVTCHQFGLEGSAATLGTALTDDHVRMLRRYTDRVTLLFDPDAAGAMASLRGGELLISEGITVDVVTLPDGLDPDEILVRDGRTALDVHLANAVPFIDYSIAQAQKRYPGASPENKLSISREILPLIAKMRDPLLQDEYLARLANALRVEKAILGQQMKRMRLESKESKSGGSVPAAKAVVTSRFRTIEEELLLIAVLYPSEDVIHALNAVAWRDPRCAEVWQTARTSLSSGTFNVAEVMDRLSSECRDWAAALAMEERSYARPLQTLEELLDGWHRQQESRDWMQLKSEIDSMIEGKIPVDPAKIQRYHDLSKKLKGSKPSYSEASLHG